MHVCLYIAMPEPSELQKQQELNHLLARYLENDDADSFGEFDDDDLIDEQKRTSMFRERGGIQPAAETPQYQSVFREREIIPQPSTNMAAEFLKEIDLERNAEREEKYKETLRRLWEKYQMQENEIEHDLFADQQKQQQHIGQMEQYKSKPMYMAATPPENHPEYFGSIVEKRRLILPWMPATRRKRFPVAKRSPPKYTADMMIDDASTSGTDEKVAKDLQAIFNEKPAEAKMMKRSSSSSDAVIGSTEKPPQQPSVDKKKTDGGSSSQKQDQQHQHDHNNNHDLDHDGDLQEDAQKPHDDDHDDHDDHEHDHDHEHEHDDDEDEDGDFDNDDDDKKKKKKRASMAKRSNLEILKEDQIIPGDLNDFRRKKSVDWSKYFGLDRKKKSGPANWYNK